MTSPMAQGLFAKAAIMSGGDGHSANVGTLAEAETIGVAFATSKGISADAPDALARLRALGADAVTDGLNLAVMFNPATRPDTFGMPFADGKIAVDSGAAYRAGAFAKVPIMIGATSADFGGRTATWWLERATRRRRSPRPVCRCMPIASPTSRNRPGRGTSLGPSR